MLCKHPLEQADWIFIPDVGDGINLYADFFENFIYDSGNVSFYVAADTTYALYINGALASQLPVNGYEDMLFYDRIDLTPYVKQGANELMLTVCTQGVDNLVARANTAGVIYTAYCDDALFCASSPKTQCRKNTAYTSGTIECVSWQLGFSFRYDETIEKSATTSAVRVNKPLPMPRPVEKLRLEESAPSQLLTWGSYCERSDFSDTGRRMQYAGLYGNEERRRDRFPNTEGSRFVKEEGCDGIWLILDMHREECGLLEFELETTENCEILIGWGQHLEDLRTRTALGGRNFAASCKKRAGRFQFVHPFKRLGARYLQLHIAANEVVIYKASLIPTIYPLNKENYFTCSDHLHNRIYEVCCRTLELCMHEHYEDCQWREQALYTMDSRNQMLCGYYCFGETKFPAASLRLIAHSLRSDGMLELCSPARASTAIPSFTAIFLRQLYEFYLYTNDIETTRELLPTAKACADGFIAKIDETGMIPMLAEKQYWNFYEWQKGLNGYSLGKITEEKITYDAPLNAFVVLGLKSLADLLIQSGDADSAVHYADAANTIAKASEDAFFDAEEGNYYSFIRRINGERYHKCELTQSLFVYADMVPTQKLAALLEHLASGKLLPVTLSYSIFKYEALLRMPEKYGRFVFDDVAKIWGEMLYAEATSFWETSEGADAFGFAGSLCHGWSAVPAYLYYRYALGFDIAAKRKASVDCGLYECNGKVKCGNYEAQT